MIKFGLQKRWFVTFFTLGVLFSCLLCLANSVLLTTKTVNINNNTRTQQQYINLTNKLNNESRSIDLTAQNIFRIELPNIIPKQLSVASEPNEQLDMPLIIENVGIMSIFGSVINIPNNKTQTRIIDIIKLSQFLQVSVNNQHLQKQSNMVISIIHILLLGFSLSLVVLISLLIIYRLFILSCSYIGKLARIDTKKTARIELIISICSIILVVSLSCLMCNVGIMHTDDGFFNLMVKYPQDVRSGLPSSYYQITHLVFIMVGENLFLFRLFTVAIGIASITVLLVVVLKFLKVSFNISFSKSQITLLFALLIVTNSFQYIHHLTPDYNNLSRVVVYAQVSIILLSLIERRYVGLLCLLLGMFTGINLFIKITEALASTLIILIVLSWVYGGYLKKLLSFILGFLFSVFIYFLFIQSWSEWYNFITSSLFYGSLVDGHQMQLLILTNIKDIIVFILYSIVIVIGYIFLMKSVLKHYSKDTLILTFIFWLSLITIYFTYALYHDIFKFLTIPAAFLLLTLGIIFYRNYDFIGSIRHLKNRLNYVCVLMLIFTYIASVGTDTPIFYHIMFHPALIIVAIILQLYYPTDETLYRNHVISILLLVCTFIVVKGSIYNSAMYDNLLQQNKPYYVNNNKVFISDSASNGLKKIRGILEKCGYQNNNYISAYYAMPQIIFALDGRSPVTPWYVYYIGNSIEKMQVANNYLYSLMTPNEKQNLFILFDNSRDINSLGLKIDSSNYCGTVDLRDNPELRVKSISVYHISK